MTGVEPYQSLVTPATEIFFHTTMSLRTFHTCLCSSYAKKSNNEYWFSETAGTSAYTLVNIWCWTLLEKKSCSLHALWYRIIASKNQGILWKQRSIPPCLYFCCSRYFHCTKGYKGEGEDIFSFTNHEESEKQREIWVAAVLQKVQSHSPYICWRMLSSAVTQTQSIIFYPNTAVDTRGLDFPQFSMPNQENL